VFIGFSEEEKGLVGAKHYLREALEAGTLDDIAAMINIDGAGMAETRVWHTKSDRALVRRLKQLAKELRVSVTESSLDGSGIMDSFPFHQRGVRVLSLHGLAPQNLNVPHTRRDDFGAVNPRHLYDTYRLVTRMLQDLDS
jgi:Zn-dependent M28 family amino/carboxypeptidase